MELECLHPIGFAWSSYQSKPYPSQVQQHRGAKRKQMEGNEIGEACAGHNAPAKATGPPKVNGRGIEGFVHFKGVL